MASDGRWYPPQSAPPPPPAKKPNYVPWLILAIVGICFLGIAGLGANSDKNRPLETNRGATSITTTTTVAPVPLVEIVESSTTIPVTEPPVTEPPPTEPPPTLPPPTPAPTLPPAPPPTTVYVPPVTSPPAGRTYANCADAKRNGAGPFYRGQPGYSSDMDGDGDGVACEAN